MCGITGAIWNDSNLAVSNETLGAMTDAISHRGPDDSGQLSNELNHQSAYGDMPGVGLGFRRLSIIDLDGGHQPLANEDESIWIIFNGEIYNYPTLRKRLEGGGHRFRTDSDTETIVHLYEDEGEECFSLLNGMFALAIWDRPQRKLIIARDRLGQKPLVYRSEPGRLSFASELKSLLQIPGFPREIDPNAIDEYLTYQYVPYPNTIFRGTHKLPPGHYGVWRDGELKVQSYWNIDFNVEREQSEDAAQSQLRELLDSSVQKRMRADVPLGAFLSGGVDSSLIVALMQKHAEQPIKTFSIGFPVKEYNETQFAREVAEHLGTEHHEFEVTPDAISILPDLVAQYDEPFADSSAIPTWYVSKMTREHVTVALSGDGGDELFAGYPRYRAVRLGQWVDRAGPMRALLGARLWQQLPGSARQKGLLRRFKRFSEAVSQPALRRYLDWISIFNESRRAAIYNDDFIEELVDSDPFQFLRGVAKRSEKRDIVTSISMTDLLTYLPCDLNTKVDMASMAHGLEVRQPFLDHRLVDFASSLAMKHKMRGLRGKQILRHAFGDLLPKSIWERPKMGFGVPLDHWFREELREMTNEVLLNPAAKCLRFFRRDAIENLLTQHQSRAFDHSYRLWSVLMLELWLQKWSAEV